MCASLFLRLDKTFFLPVQNKFVILQPENRTDTSMSESQIAEKIKANVHDIDPQAEVWLYGSRARGTEHAESDWDVLVLSPQASLSVKDEGVFIDHMTDLMIETGQVVHLFAYGKADWHGRHSVTPFYQNVTREAIRL